MNHTVQIRPSRDADATRNRLLDAAEALFADRGYHAVSMRDIARRARVNLAAAGYHYGSKENLFVEAISRRIRPLNERRLAALSALEARKKPPALAEIFDAFARAMIEEAVCNPETGRRLNRLLSRAFAESDEIAQHVFRQELLHVALRFIQAVRRVSPGLSEEQAGLGIALYAGCMIHMLRWVSSPPFPDLVRDQDTPDVDTLMDTLVSFGSAGFKQLASRAKRKGCKV
ncbi:MAG: TetR/AcrR family transcriptional regulator [bacterium]